MNGVLRNMSGRCFLAGYFLFAGLFSCSLHATTLFSDNFTGVTSGALNSSGWYFNNTTGGGNAMSISTSSVSPLGGQVLSNSGGGDSWTLALKQFSTVSLTNVGDTLSVSLNFLQVGTGTTQFKLGFVNSATTVSADLFGTTNAISDAVGYGLTQNMSSSASSPSLVRISSSSTNRWFDTLSTPSESVVDGDNLAHTLTYTLTKVSSGVQISAVIDGTTFSSYTYTGTTYLYTTFNTLILSDGGAAPFYVDNITATFTPVPESSTCVMSIVGLAFLMGISALCRRQPLVS